MPLTREENEILTRVTGDAPMGKMMRNYWVPACLAEEVAEPDCTPIRVTLFGERLVVFRDTEGKVGIIDERCPHRLASLALGRNEEGGIRCIYHGWKFNTAGACTEMPTEPGAFGFRDRMHVTSYPAHEAGKIIWAYMGARESQPEFPLMDWMQLPESQYGIYKVGERVNYAQAIEGAIDSSHSWFLHKGAVWDWEKRLSVSADTSPAIEAEDTKYGFRYAAIRIPTQNPDTERYIRVTLHVLPFLCCIPRPLEKEKYAHIQIFTPVDDERTMYYGIFFSQNGTNVSDESVRQEYHAVPGEHLDRNWYKLDTEANWYGQDRALMKKGDWTGIKGFSNQDMACQESMGPIVDRTQEHLGTSDKAIIRFRKRMIDASRAYAADGSLVGAGVDYSKVRSEQLVVPIERPWQSVGAYAGEYKEPTTASV
jgi:phthalate 4,5-dioxygenase oxygenase subunit